MSLFRFVLESAVSSAVISWGNSVRDSDSKKANKVIKKAGCVLGINLEPLELTVLRKMVHNLQNTHSDCDLTTRHLHSETS